MLGASVLLGMLSITVATPRLPPGARVGIVHPVLAMTVRQALRGAQKRVDSPDCRRIFTDFKDGHGRNLQERLDALGTTAHEYLELIHFRSGAEMAACRRSSVVAVTSPGSRVVWMCPAFESAQRHDRRLGEVVVLHEALHSLGLAENPPSSSEITARVMKRCSR